VSQGSGGAKVAAVRAAAYCIPTDQPESDGTLAWDSTVLVVAEVDAEGVTGLGYTYTHEAAVPLIIGKLADIVTGMNPLDVAAANAAMVREVRSIGATGLVSAAISAVDIALWDLKSRIVEQPLTTVLDAVHLAVPIYGSGGFTSYDDEHLAGQLAGWVAEGIPRVKMKTGREPDRDRERLHTARKAIGDDVELFVDANGAFQPRQAIEWSQVYRDEFAVSWFEEPVSSDDLRALRLVRECAPGGLDIAAGEYGWAPWLLEPMLALGAVDCLQVDVTRCLGITGSLTVAGLCEAYHYDLSAHCAPQISAHACTAVRRLRHVEYFHDHVRIESLLFDGVLAPDGGALQPDRSRHGHGLRFKYADAEQFRVA
jgi:L-alanine-DL-glutamate epimerase-like enolase superfamily enzyme